MSVKVEPYANDPILIVTFTGMVTIEDFDAIYRTSALYMTQSGAPLAWRLLDLTKAEVPFPVVMSVVRSFDPDAPGSFADPRIHTVFTEPHPMASLLRDLMLKATNGNMEMTVYPGLGEALMFAQEAIYNLRTGQGG